MIAATGSGRGKTTFVMGLLNVLKNRSSNSEACVEKAECAVNRLHAFKCGPDYIDPMFHREVLGIQSTNLDSFFCDEDLLNKVFDDNAADINIIEAAMGLYDGIGTGSRASAYDVASILKCPVVLLIDGSGMGYSIVALIKGFLSMDSCGLIKGVVINRIYEKYYSKIAPVIEKETGIRVLGFVPRVKDAELKSRHLGLMNPDENDFAEKIKLISEQIEKNVDINALVESGIYNQEEEKLCEADKGREEESCNEEVKCRKLDREDASRKKALIAVARDEAFSFIYEENIRLLERLGADIVYFSPVHDKEILSGSYDAETDSDAENKYADQKSDTKYNRKYDGIILYGGYPENYAKELSENISMKEEIRKAAESGVAILAECGGFMYLLESMNVNGTDYEMAGAIKGKSSRTQGLVRFGYVNVDIDGIAVKGHEFHHFEAEGVDYADDCRVTNEASGDSYKGIVRNKNIIAGFPHLYYPGSEEFIRCFLLGKLIQ